jgi:hypothetical protein
MMSVRVRDVSIPVSKVDLRPDPAGITSLSDPELTTVTCAFTAASAFGHSLRRESGGR